MLACELTALGIGRVSGAKTRAAWSEAEAVALESPTALVERVETIAGTPGIF